MPTILYDIYGDDDHLGDYVDDFCGDFNDDDHQ